MSTYFEIFVCEKALEASKLYIDNLVKEAGPPVEKPISFGEAKDWNGIGEFIDFLGLPKASPRKIDEEYTPPPTRYLVVSPEIGALLCNAEKMDYAEKTISLMFRKFEGTFQYYEIFIGSLFKLEHVLAVEDTSEGKAKVLGYFYLKGIFDLNAALEKVVADIDEVAKKKEM